MNKSLFTLSILLTLLLGWSISPAASPQDIILTLPVAIARALQDNRALADTRDQKQVARLSLTAAKSEFELKIIPASQMGVAQGEDNGTAPNLALGVTVAKKIPWGTEVSVTPAYINDDEGSRGEVAIKLRQPLLRGWGEEYNLSALKEAQFNFRTSQRNLYLKKVESVLGAVERFYMVLLQNKVVGLLRQAEVRLSGYAEAAAIKQSMHLASQIDLLRAQIKLKQAQESLNLARQAERDAADDLKVFLALPMGQKITVRARLKYDAPKFLEQEAVDIALQNRQEVYQAKDMVRERRRLSRVAYEDTWPKLDILFSHKFSQANDDSSLFATDYNWSLNLVSSTDVNRTAEKARYAATLVNIQGAQRGEWLVRDQIAMQVKSRVRSLYRLYADIDNQRDQIEKAQAQIQLALVKFRHGMASNFDVIEAETNLQSAQINLITAVVNYIVGQYRLRAGLGTLLAKPQVKSW